MAIYIPFIYFSSQIDFDLKSINQEFFLFLNLLKKNSIRYFTIELRLQIEVCAICEFRF